MNSTSSKIFGSGAPGTLPPRARRIVWVARGSTARARASYSRDAQAVSLKEMSMKERKYWKHPARWTASMKREIVNVSGQLSLSEPWEIET